MAGWWRYLVRCAHDFSALRWTTWWSMRNPQRITSKRTGCRRRVCHRLPPFTLYLVDAMLLYPLIFQHPIMVNIYDGHHLKLVSTYVQTW